MAHISGRSCFSAKVERSHHSMDTFLYSLSHTRLAAAGDARQNFDPTSANELGSIHNVTSDSTSTEKEDRTSVETEASGDGGACNGSTNGKASSSGGSSGYEASLATLRDARNSDESSGGQCARKPQRSTQPMPARTVDHLASPCAIASGPTRKSSRLRNKQRRARPEPDACLETGLFTLMLRQIPRHYTQLVFLADVSRCGFMELVDFIYIPFDNRKGKNVGYGFIGFTETPHALAFIQKFDGAYMDTEMRNQGKPLRIHPAAAVSSCTPPGRACSGRTMLRACGAALQRPCRQRRRPRARASWASTSSWRRRSRAC
ncbi:unnamed protein product [Prorocentrum cordatum]|uniref:RRM domain-containing protein n=1 Tax=Prorocentrum cordatum TaxID=2364126 RepID=A0ABN9W207_9DINO|nr:unnamed protein product [Polarella glacialis]